MKILLSAYACEPHKGSEPGVGWNWMLELIRQGHNVSVITRENNRAVIEREIQSLSIPVTIAYHDLPAWCRKWKPWPGGLYFYYLAWQFGAYHRARKLHKMMTFDVVHGRLGNSLCLRSRRRRGNIPSPTPRRNESLWPAAGTPAGPADRRRAVRSLHDPHLHQSLANRLHHQGYSAANSAALSKQMPGNSGNRN